MNLKKNKYISLGVVAFLTYVACVLFKQFTESYTIYSVFSMIVDILMPFIIGFALAYLLNPVMTFFEKRVIGRLFEKKEFEKKKSVVRGISLILTFSISLALVIALIFALLPQVLVSLIGIFKDLPDYIKDIYSFIEKLVQDNQSVSDFLEEQFKDVRSYAQELSNMVLPSVSNLLSGITVGVVNFIGGIIDMFAGLIVSIYVLFAKEKFVSQSKKVIVAITPKKFAYNLITVFKETHNVFGKFISGQVLDAALVGIITGIGMIFIYPTYALLFGVVTGIFNMIPFFGPIIGAVPCAILLLLESPSKCIVFVIFIIALQQFDGNVLSPKILGGKIGLSAFWVMFAIFSFNALFGILGMFIGVPIFAVIYTWIRRYINSRLSKKGLSTKTSDYLLMNAEKLAENEKNNSNE